MRGLFLNNGILYVVMKGISVITFRATLLCACALVAAPLSAQTSTDQENGDNEDIVVTALGIEQPQKDIGVSISTLNDDDLERRRNVAIVDQLRMLPGVTVTRNGPVGGIASVRIRGAESQQTLVLIDGIAVNDPSSPSDGFDFGTLLGSNISNIEVFRGANSTTWGSDAIGGVVSVETLAPDEHGLNLTATGEYGSHDSKRFSAAVADQVGSVGYALGGGFYDTDGISAAQDGTEADGMRQYLGHGRLDVGLGEIFTVELRGFYSHSKVDYDGTSWTAPYLPEDQSLYSTSQQANGYAGAKIDLAGGNVISRVGYSIADINRDNYNPIVDNEPTFIGRGRTDTLSYRGDYTISNAHRLLFGASHTVNKLRTDDGWSTAKAKNNIDGFYGQWIFSPIDGLNMVAGVRHDDHSIFGGHTSLAGNIAYFVTPQLKLRSSYSEGFKAPTLFQLDGTAGGFGNPDLKPEKARSIDAGIELYLLDEAVSMAATAFTRTTRDQIDYISCPTSGGPAICESGERPFGTYENVTKTRARGFELELKAQPVSQMIVAANYSYTATRDLSDGSFNEGNRLARRPVHTGFISVDYVGRAGWNVGADLYLAGDSYDDVANSRRLDGYALVGLRAAVPVAERFELFGRIENATDAEYVTSYGYNSMGRAFYGGIKANF